MTTPPTRPTGASPPRSPRRAATTRPPAAKARPTATEPGQVVLAVVTGAHGVGGEVKLKVFADDLSAFAAFNGGSLTLRALRNGHIARFAEVADRTAAEALRGVMLTVPREALPPLDPGEYYHADLIGRRCTADGHAIGQVVAVENFGAGDILEIEKADGRTFMVPIHAAVLGEVIEIDPAFVE